MIFQNEQEIEHVLLNNPNKDLIVAGRAMADNLHSYITGEGLKQKLAKLPYFEKDELLEIRTKLTRSTMDVFVRLFQPIEKVFTAKGGIFNYNLSPEQEAKFGQRMMNVRKGMSMDEWVQFIGLQAYLTDPMSLSYTEIDAKGYSYPTYKSTSCIFDYALTGRKPEYVVFTLSNDEVAAIVAAGKVPKMKKGDILYRVVDDAFDRYVIRNGRKFQYPYQIPNYFKYVPGQIVSDIVKFGTYLYLSPAHSVMELAADFLNDNSSKSLFKKYQMFLKEWGIAIDCIRCNGEGKHDGEDCHTCNGKGILATTKVSEKINIVVGEGGKAESPLPPGGFYGPGTESWNMMNQELDSLKQDIHDTFWTNSKQVKTQGPDVQQNQIQTATGEVYSERGKEMVLRKFSKWGQNIYKFQADNIKKVEYRSLTINESTIVFGQRYLLESPDELKKKYIELKKSQASYPVLDAALLAALEVEYSGDVYEMRRQIIMMKLEPFVHHPIETVLSWSYLPDIDRKKKLYFSEWVHATDKQLFYMGSEREILANFEDFLSKKPDLVKPEPVKVPA